MASAGVGTLRNAKPRKGWQLPRPLSLCLCVDVFIPMPVNDPKQAPPHQVKHVALQNRRVLPRPIPQVRQERLHIPARRASHQSVVQLPLKAQETPWQGLCKTLPRCVRRRAGLPSGAPSRLNSQAAETSSSYFHPTRVAIALCIAPSWSHLQE